MTGIRELAAGVVCVGFEGTDPRAIDDRLVRTPFAGFILFARNVVSPEQTRDLAAALQESSALPRIIAIDQEGGRVARLRTGVEELPSMMALSAAADTDLCRRAGEQLAFDLRRAGVNIDYAPVLDLALFEKNTVIGARSFGDDPRRVASFAGAFAQGMRAQGIIPTFKHFPGHGSTDVDSHLDLPVIDVDAGTLRARDLAPFAALLPGAQALMTAHIVVHAFDRANAATISHAVLTGLLRGEIGFEGVCFTDCMQMDAIAKGVGSAAGAVQAVAAGADCVLVSHSIDLALQIVDAICAAVNAGAIARERLDEAYARVQKLRAALQGPLPIDAPAPYAGIGREIGRAAVTLIRGSAQAGIGSSLVVSFEGTTTEGVQGTHSQHAALEGNPETVRAPLQPAASDVQRLLACVRESHKRPIVLMRRAHVYEAQRLAIAELLDLRPQALLVSTREPYDAFKFSQAQNVICTYGDDAPSMQGLSDVLFRGVQPRGQYPLESA